jgi:hypothetical protein
VAALAQPQERFMSAQEQPETALSGKAQKAMQTLRKNPLYEKVQLVRMGALDKVQKKGRFMLALPGKPKEYEARMTHLRAKNNTDYVWMGELPDSLGSITLVAEKGMVRGHIGLGGDDYEIFSLENGMHALAKVNMKKLANIGCGTKETTTPVTPKKERTNANARQDPCYTSPDQVVRVLVCFTGNAQAQDPNVVGTAQLAIAQTNNHGYAFLGGGIRFVWTPFPALIIEPNRPRATVMLSQIRPFYEFPGGFNDSSEYAQILAFSTPNLTVAYEPAGTGDNNNAQWLDERFPTVANYQQSAFLSSNIEGPTHINPNSLYSWEAVYRCGNGPYLFQWELSSDGWNYYSVGNQETFSSYGGFTWAGNPSFLRLTVQSADNQVSTSYKELYRIDGGRIAATEPTDKIELFDAYPNPTTGETVIEYALPVAANVKLDVVNQTGQVVSLLVEGKQEAGKHTTRLQGEQLPAGLYLYRLQADGAVTTKRLIIAH